MGSLPKFLIYKTPHHVVSAARPTWEIFWKVVSIRHGWGAPFTGVAFIVMAVRRGTVSNQNKNTSVRDLVWTVPGCASRLSENMKI
jgi:hypothetical protein